MSVREKERVCVNVCECVCEREREWVCVNLCVNVCVREKERVCECVDVCVGVGACLLELGAQ